jgi:hypothetical protein
VPANLIGPHLRTAPRRYAAADPDDPTRVTIRRAPGDDTHAIRVPVAQLRALVRAWEALREAQLLIARAERLP